MILLLFFIKYEINIIILPLLHINKINALFKFKFSVYSDIPITKLFYNLLVNII